MRPSSEVHLALADRDDVVAGVHLQRRLAVHRVGRRASPPPRPTSIGSWPTRSTGDPVLAGNVLFAEEPGAALFVALTDKQAGPPRWPMRPPSD